VNTTEMTEVIKVDTDKPSHGVGPTGMPKVDEGLSLTNDTFAEDMAKLAAMAGSTPQTDTTPTTTETSTPTTPEQPVNQAPVTDEATKVDVPEKFKTPDGKIDVAKVEKSLMSAEETLAKYLAKEKELKRKMNDARKTEAGLPPSELGNIQVSPEFAAQFEKDVQTMGLGNAVIRLQTATLKAAEEAAYSRAMKDIEGIKEVTANQTTRNQIEAIAKSDPWVYTPEGLNTLTTILDSQPYLWQAADPYKAAYVHYKGLNVASQQVPQVLTPTPTARPSAPVPTGQAAAPANNTPSVRLDSKEAINTHLKKLTAEQQSEFFKKMGFPGF